MRHGVACVGACGTFNKGSVLWVDARGTDADRGMGRGMVRAGVCGTFNKGSVLRAVGEVAASALELSTLPAVGGTCNSGQLHTQSQDQGSPTDR